MTRASRPHPPGFRPPVPEPDEEPAARTGRVRRRIEVPTEPDRIWQALTDPAELAAWWGDGSHLEARPGGDGLLVEDGAPARRARVVEVRRSRRLVLDWWPDDPEVDDPASRVTIELVPSPGGTVVTIEECQLLDLRELPVLVAPREPLLWGRGAGATRSRALVGG